MEFLNNDIKFAKMRRKSKIKYNLLIKNSKDTIPSFLSTKHFYKRRKKQGINLSNQNINPNDKANHKLSFPKKSRQKHKSLSLLDDGKVISNSNPLGIDTNNENKAYKQLKPLTLFEKIKIKAILNSFEKNKLTTHSLYNLEKKYPLNSITENNYLFFFRDYKDKKRQSIKQLISTGKANMSKSSLISLNMMKKFNNRTNKILEADKTEGTKFSNNINEFRKQIINSYKDSFVLRDLNKRKINYDNAMNLLETNKEKRIQKAFELEKEFYKNKNSDTQYLLDSNYIIPEIIEPKKRKSKKTPTTIVKRLDEKIAYLSPNTNAKKTKNYNNLTISKSKGIHHNTVNCNTIKLINMNNISNYFNKTETNNNSNILKEKASKSLQNSNKKKLSKASDNSLLNGNRTNNNTFNNKYLNYIYNTNNNTNANIRGKKHSIKNIDKSEREFLNSKEEYKRYIKNCMKQRSKQFADSLASINSYFEYQPLIDMNSDMPHLNINSTNLKRVIKVNNIRKNLYIVDDDDLLIQNVKKLKDEVRDAEMKFYTVDGNKKNIIYHF